MLSSGVSRRRRSLLLAALAALAAAPAGFAAQPASAGVNITFEAPTPVSGLAGRLNRPIGTATRTSAGAPSDCLSRPTVTPLTGTFTSSYRGKPASGTTVDARGAVFAPANGWVVVPGSATNVCWVGGTYRLTVDDTVSTSSYSASPRTAWSSIWHHNGGVTTKYGQSGWIWDGVSISHVGDAFNISDGSNNFEIRGSHLSDVRDDCVQNDKFLAGAIRDSFLDGCYVAFSARASGKVPDGSANTWTVTGNVVWVRPMWSVYKGDSPGNGEIFKWDKANLAKTPKLVFRDNIVRVGRTPFQAGAKQGTFYVPPGTDFANNVLVWDGPGTPPPSLTKWFDAAHGSRVGTMADWDAAVAAWRAAHPDVP